MSNKVNKILASTFALGVIALPLATLTNKQKYENIVEPISSIVPYENDFTLSGLHNPTDPSSDDIENYLPYGQHSYTADVNWTFTLPENVPDIVTIEESTVHSKAGSTNYDVVLFHWNYWIKHHDVVTRSGETGERILTPTIDGEWITLQEYSTSVHYDWGNSKNHVFWKYSWKYGESNIYFKFTDAVDQDGSLYGDSKAFQVLNWLEINGEYQYFN